MRRMSQVHFEQVTSWQEAKLAHERFVTDYNAQPRLRAPQVGRSSAESCGSPGQETVPLSAEAALGVGGDFVAAWQAAPRLRSSKKTAKENRAGSSTLAFLSFCMLYSLQILKLIFSGKKVVQMPQSLKSMGARCVTSNGGGRRFGQMPIP
jgi:hypothetical protein